MLQLIRNFLVAFCQEALIHVLRGPLLVVALMPLIATTGAWQFLASSWAALDAKRTAELMHDTSRLPRVALVAIDDSGYQGYFEARSPLNRARLAALLQTVSEHSRSARRITVDLDVSPVPGQSAEQAQLDQQLLRDPRRWVLPAINSGSAADIDEQQQWRRRLCARGLSFGLPYIPNEFGYPRLTHQFHDSLADASLKPPGLCADPAKPMTQTEMILSPAILSTTLVIPFSGDLDSLAAILDYVEADWIMVGGTWGQTDIFATPFGDRFGVQVHLAALAGELSHEREASHLVSIISALGFVSLCTLILKQMNDFFEKRFRPLTPKMVGHSFYLERLQPLFFIVAVILLLMLLSELLSLIRAHTGYWIPTSIVASTTLGMLFLTWNWGQNKAESHESFHHMWKEIVSEPIRQDLHSISMAFQVAHRGPHATAWDSHISGDVVSRRRALVEGLLALTSLTLQSAVPVGTLLYAFLHTSH